MSSKGQIVLPAELRELDKIHSGQGFTIERLEAGAYLLKRVESTAEGLVDWLRSCPHDEWFEPLPSESTDTL